MKKYSIHDQKELAAWACDCAERVLIHFESSCPDDTRPRNALKTCREWIETGEFHMTVIRGASLAAHEAARSVRDDLPAFNAARAAGQAVATAHVTQHAFGVFYALRAVAESCPDKAEEKFFEEYHWQAQHIPAHLREEYLKRIVIRRKKSGLYIGILKDKDF